MIFTLAANNISQRSHFDKKIHFNIYIASPEGIYFDDGYADCMAMSSNRTTIQNKEQVLYHVN